MDAVDPKDMTASELLRLAANGEENEYGYRLASRKLFCALLGKDAYIVRPNEDQWALRSLADKIDAELAQARRSGLERAAKSWAKANGWPDFREGEDFGAWLDRCAIPRPRFEDGEPVQIGDRAQAWGRDHTVERIGVEVRSNECLLIQYVNSPEERLKRPATEALGADGLPIKEGETVWDIYGGGPAQVYRIGPADDEDGPVVWDIEGNYTMPYLLTHEHPVLGADGLPIKVGDTVWLVDEYSQYAGSNGSANGNEYSLFGVDPQETLFVEYDRLVVSGKNYVRLSTCNAWCHASWLTHTPPDTQERIDEDAEKFHCVYFGGYSACGTCPASTGELSKKSCKQQQIFDLLRRQRELDKRTGGE